MTKLEILNKLLKSPDLKLPTFRQTVDKSGSNLPWLRKHVAKDEATSKELKELLSLNMKELYLAHAVVKTFV